VPTGLALGKEFFFKKNKKSLPSACRVDTRQSDRQRDRRHDGRFSLPSVPGALGKEGFADQIFAVCSLPGAALGKGQCGKGFAECNLAFAECLRHSAKNLNPVVHHAKGIPTRGVMRRAAPCAAKLLVLLGQG